MIIQQYEIYVINLDPTIGHEIKKTRPCVVISPDEMNRNIHTIIVAPMTTKSHDYPTRVQFAFQDKQNWIVLDQIRSLDKKRFVKKIGGLDDITIQKVKNVIKEMLVD
jgi:mRNA interferase MazF